MKTILKVWCCIFLCSGVPIFGMTQAHKKRRTESSLYECPCEGDVSFCYAIDDLNYGALSINLTPLHEAARFGCLRGVRKLISEGSAILAEDWHGKPPIVFAARAGKTEVVKELLLANMYMFNREKDEKKREKLFNQIDDSIQKAFISAIRYDQVSVVDELIKLKLCEVNKPSKTGSFPVHEAARSGSLKVLKKLIETYKAEVNCRDNRGETPLHSALEFTTTHVNAKNIIELILGENRDSNRANINVQDGSSVGRIGFAGRTPLIKAVDWNLPSIAKYLLRLGASATVCDQSGKAALHYARSADIADTLINYETKIDAIDSYGCTPLHCAVINEKFDVIQILVNRGASMDCRNYNGQTPKDLATHYKAREIFRVEENRRWFNQRRM